MHSVTGEIEETIIFLDELRTFSQVTQFFFEIQNCFKKLWSLKPDVITVQILRIFVNELRMWQKSVSKWHIGYPSHDDILLK